MWVPLSSMATIKGEPLSHDMKRTVLRGIFILIFIFSVYLAVIGNWGVAAGLVVLLSVFGVGYMTVQKTRERRQVAEAVAEELDRSDEWEAVRTAITVCPVDNPYENKELIGFFTDLIVKTNRYSVSQALSLSPYPNKSLDQIQNDSDFEFLVEIIYSGNVSNVIGRVTHDPYQIQEEMEELKRKHNVPEVDPAHKYQLKQGNLGKAAVAGVLESAIEQEKNLEYTARIRSHKNHDIIFTDGYINFTINEVENLSGDKDRIEEGDVVEFDFKIEVSDRGLEPSTINTVRFLHENERHILDNIREIKESLDGCVEAAEQLVELHRKGSITKREFDSQLESVLTDGIQNSIPPIHVVEYIERLDIYREYNTISDSDYRYAKSLLLDQEAILMSELESSSIRGANLEQAKDIVC